MAIENSDDTDRRQLNTASMVSQFSPKTRATLAYLKIKPQFPDTPHGQLYCNVVRQAINDLAAGADKKATSLKNKAALKAQQIRRDAINYFNQPEIFGVEQAGVSSTWVREILQKFGLLPEANNQGGD